MTYEKRLDYLSVKIAKIILKAIQTAITNSTEQITPTHEIKMGISLKDVPKPTQAQFYDRFTIDVVIHPIKADASLNPNRNPQIFVGGQLDHSGSPNYVRGKITNPYNQIHLEISYNDPITIVNMITEPFLYAELVDTIRHEFKHAEQLDHMRLHQVRKQFEYCELVEVYEKNKEWEKLYRLYFMQPMELEAYAAGITTVSLATAQKPQQVIQKLAQRITDDMTYRNCPESLTVPLVDRWKEAIIAIINQGPYAKTLLAA
jgi:hypothetical protein